MNIKHLHLHVRNRPAAEQFYVDWFKMAVARHSEQLTFITDSSGFGLALMDDEAPQPLPSWFHFGFRLESASAVGDLHDRMSGSGVRIVKPLHHGERLTSFRCADPDGHTVEIYSERAAA